MNKTMVFALVVLLTFIVIVIAQVSKPFHPQDQTIFITRER